jgi:hypothetical protein
VYVQGGPEFGYRLKEPSGVFTSELAALLSAFCFIENKSIANSIVITDSLSSIEALKSQKICFKTHPLILQCKEILWRLLEKNQRIVIMWVPSHVGIEGNEKVDEIARESIRDAPFWRHETFRNDLLPSAKAYLLAEWQKRWNEDQMGRFTFSICPGTSLSPWFARITERDRAFIVTTSRIISNHTRVRSHLNRIQILPDPVCVCGGDYETVDHILWHCPRFNSDRQKLEYDMDSLDISYPIAIRDLLGLKNFNAAQKCVDFLKVIEFNV